MTTLATTAPADAVVEGGADNQLKKR